MRHPVGDVLLDATAGAALGSLRLRHRSPALLRRRRLATAGDAYLLPAPARPCVVLCPLAGPRQPAAVAKSAIGADLRQPLDVLRAIPAKVTLDLLGLDGLAKLHDLVVGQILDVGVRIDPGVLHDLARRGLADPVNVGETHLHSLVGRDVDACDSSHAPTPASACGAGSSR